MIDSPDLSLAKTMIAGAVLAQDVFPSPGRVSHFIFFAPAACNTARCYHRLKCLSIKTFGYLTVIYCLHHCGKVFVNALFVFCASVFAAGVEKVLSLQIEVNEFLYKTINNYQYQI